MIHQAKNLILDGGFEKGAALSSSFPDDIFSVGPETGQHVLDSCDSQKTIVATLIISSEHRCIS